MLIGNLTRDVELRYTPSGTAVATFGLATNRSWSTGDGGERQEETQFHRIVAWSKLAEICGQLLFKGRKVFIEGRLQTRKWTSQDGQQRETTEIVAENMMILDTRSREGGAPGVQEEDFVSVDDINAANIPPADMATADPAGASAPADDTKKTKAKKAPAAVEPAASDEINVEDIPF